MKIRLLPASLALASLAHAATTDSSYWKLGEAGSLSGTAGTPGAFLDSAGTPNNFNNSTGTTVNTATPSGVAGSTAYASTTGANNQGIWMFGSANGGSLAETIPSDNWGFQVMVRSTDTATILAGGNGAFRSVLGFKDATTGGLCIEAFSNGTDVFWDVNRAGQANLIAPRNASTRIVDNTWTNLALVLDGGTLKFFVNQSLIGSIANNPGVTFQTDGMLALGLRQGFGTNNFKGDYDEARLFTFGAGQFDAATDLSYGAIPEPSTYGLIGAGSLATIALVRRRRRG